MKTMKFSFYLFLIVLRIGSAYCTLIHTSGSSETLLQYGSAGSFQTFLLSIDDDEKLVQAMLNTSERHIITSHQISTEKLSDNRFNISTSLYFDFLPGVANYSLTILTQTVKGDAKKYTLSQTHSVYGMVFISDSSGTVEVISGDFGIGFNLTSFVDLNTEPFRIKSIVHVPEGIELAPSVEVEGQKNKTILEEEDVILDEQGMLIMPHPYRTGSAMVIIKSENLKTNGESFETAIAITIPDTPQPPAVVNQKGVQKVEIGRNGTVEVRLDMFNVRNDSKLTLLLDDLALPAVFQQSVTNGDVQKILFRGGARAGKYNIHVTTEMESGEKDVVSLYESQVLVRKQGEVEKSGVNVMAILLIAFGGLAAVIVAMVLRISWVQQQSEAQEREMQQKCACATGDEKGDVQYGIVRDVYGRGSEQV